MQSSGHVESQGLLSLFLSPCWKTWTCPGQSWMLGLWKKPMWMLDSPWQHVQRCNKRGRVCCHDGTVAPGELTFHISQVSRKGQEWWTSSVQKLSPCPG